MSFISKSTQPISIENPEPQKRGKIEDSLNPWVRLTLYFGMIIIGGTIYWGWNGIQSILYKSGSFADLCTNQPNISYVKIGNNDYIDCGMRKSGINNLFTLAYSAHLSFTIFNGFLLDHLGPKYAYMICQFCNFIAWLFIGLFPRNPTVLKFFFFLMGATAEGLVMPLITVSYFFKKHRSLIICITGSAISLSYIVPIILSGIFSMDCFKPNGMSAPTIGYAVLGNFVCFLLGYIFVHKRLPSDEKEDDDIELSTVVEKKETRHTLWSNILYLKNNFRVLLRSSKLYEYLLVLVCSSIYLQSLEFINKSHREILATSDGRTSANVFKYVQFLTFIPVPLFGLLIDKVGPAIVNSLLYLLAVLFFVFVIADEFYTKLIAIFFYFLTFSSCISGLYSQISKRFPSHCFGTLSGIVMLCSGIVSLVNIPLYDMATNQTALPLTQRFLVPLYILTVLTSLCFLMSGINIYLNHRKEE
ncbi:major facilitator superfamily MFS-1 protein [Theileria orientalis]|uniref:Major facilitator superfamily MFS-1 protein n=1 Tax=Theileria orientalis TaxID=68886 RepID=A0A976SKH9_THEOR|nr:major facilitator superfamily MFS-1 protein [Theileria orientalis]